MKYKILKSHHKQLIGSNRLPIKVYKIICLKTFSCIIKGSRQNGFIDRIVTVKEGEIGGYIQSESNLSQSDTSWVFNNATICDSSTLSHSTILEDALICDGSTIINSTISGKCRIFKNSTIIESYLTNNVDVCENSEVNNSYLYNSVRINGQSKVERCTLDIGARVNKRSQLIYCVVTDQCEITDGAKCENCDYSGQTFIKGGNHLNETLNRVIELNIESVADPSRILDF